MKKYIVLQFFVILIICFVTIYAYSCMKGGPKDRLVSQSSDKYDLWMYKAIQETEADDVIRFSVICKDDLTRNERVQVEETGVLINTVAGDVFTAKGTKKQIKELAAMEFVLKISSAKPMKPR